MRNISRYSTRAVLAAGVVALAAAVAPAAPGSSATPWLWQRCSHVNTKYKHGVGKRYAHDRTRSTTEPVTNFYRSTRLYNVAMSYNKRLDADKTASPVRSTE
jgi:Excalibur calcium-binding domain